MTFLSMPLKVMYVPLATAGQGCSVVFQCSKK